MAFIFKLMTICAVIAISSAQLNFNNPALIPEYIQTQSSYIPALQQPPSYQPTHETPLDINLNFQQLPKPDAPYPFLTVDPQPSAILKAPTEGAVVTNFNPNHQNYQNPYSAIPAEELQLPSLVKWNPNNDPNLYYPVEVTPKIANQKTPTSLYPKKYNKEPKKVKSIGYKPKESVSEAEQQKQLDKVLYALAKQENKKLLELEKLEKSAFVENSDNSDKVTDPVPAESGFNGFSHGFPSHGAANNGFSHGLSSGISSGVSSGVSSHGGSGERMEFHVQGHQGPKSYKWGFDTGKGHNRQFRYEERGKDGIVKGHYGYYDKHGNLRMVHYDSHPHEGFHATNNNGNYGHY